MIIAMLIGLISTWYGHNVALRVRSISSFSMSVTSTSITLSTQGDSTDATTLTSNTTNMELDTTTDSLDLVINELNKAELI